MAFKIRQADYFYATVNDPPEEADKLAELGINLLAFTAIPVGPMRTQFTIFPEDDAKMVNAARLAGLDLDGPYPALLVQGDDELGALASVHGQLQLAGVNVYAASGNPRTSIAQPARSNCKLPPVTTIFIRKFRRNLSRQ
jgi:hypothetical protein